VRLATPRGDKRIRFTLRFMEQDEGRQLVFLPLLNRFLRGQDHRTRAVKISDSGRIRNELQTLCSDALEFFGERGIRVHLGRIPQEVISLEDQERLRDVLEWYKENHPVWFAWLEIAA
jgi:hypothetical protein